MYWPNVAWPVLVRCFILSVDAGTLRALRHDREDCVDDVLDLLSQPSSGESRSDGGPRSGDDSAPTSSTASVGQCGRGTRGDPICSPGRSPGRQPVQRRRAADPVLRKCCGQVQGRLRVDMWVARRGPHLDQQMQRLGQSLLIGSEVLLLWHRSSVAHAGWCAGRLFLPRLGRNRYPLGVQVVGSCLSANSGPRPVVRA